MAEDPSPAQLPLGPCRHDPVEVSLVYRQRHAAVAGEFTRGGDHLDGDSRVFQCALEGHHVVYRLADDNALGG